MRYRYEMPSTIIELINGSNKINGLVVSTYYPTVLGLRKLKKEQNQYYWGYSCGKFWWNELFWFARPSIYINNPNHYDNGEKSYRCFDEKYWRRVDYVAKSKCSGNRIDFKKNLWIELISLIRATPYLGNYKYKNG